MPSLTAQTSRHTVIDQRPGQYLCFPDLCLAPDGRIIAAYNEYDRHVGARRSLLLKTSLDLGRTWSAPRLLCARRSHCPRLTRLGDGQLVLSDDFGPTLWWSRDSGENWAERPAPEIQHSLLDRIVELNPETLLITGHTHRGTFANPKTRQAPTEQMVYRSKNRGHDWEALSVMAYDRNLVLCEASMVRLPDARLLALLRENSFVFEPMYKCLSKDNGRTWSDPEPTPLIGHRPSLGLTSGGRLLVTYRNLGPNSGLAAWMGLEQDLDEFAVHGLASPEEAAAPARDGLRIRTRRGKGDVVRYALRPMTDPEQARAELEAEVRVLRARRDGVGLRLGRWWRLFPDRIEPDVEDAGSAALEPGRFNRIRLTYSPGACTLSVNGRRRMRIRIDPGQAEARPVLMGTVSAEGDNAAESVWKRVSLRIREPRYGRSYHWAWDSSEGTPDRRAEREVLELMNDRLASPADFGYSGWIELPDGSFLCAYHFGGGRDPDYQPGLSSRVMATRFFESDFKA
ncbi:MAG: sialidase family protein [Desulfovibrionaceae bacterium]|nr:exo-alpha-sialidase [Desulfovibrionaceae bacterium]MDD4951783.1 sialidase family protein [Desulfovibrionaceae bacterium]